MTRTIENKLSSWKNKIRKHYSRVSWEEEKIIHRYPMKHFSTHKAFRSRVIPKHRKMLPNTHKFVKVAMNKTWIMWKPRKYETFVGGDILNCSILLAKIDWHKANLARTISLKFSAKLALVSASWIDGYSKLLEYLALVKRCQSHAEAMLLEEESFGVGIFLAWFQDPWDFLSDKVCESESHTKFCLLSYTHLA